MKNPTQHLINVRIDKLTNSIENVISGDSFKTEILPSAALILIEKYYNS